MKKLLIALIAMTLVFANVGMCFAQSSPTTGRTSAVSQRLQQIDQKYKVGDTLSVEDAAFILENSVQTDQSNGGISTESITVVGGPASFPITFGKTIEKNPNVTIAVTGPFGCEPRTTQPTSPFWAKVQVDFLEKASTNVTKTTFRLKATGYALITGSLTKVDSQTITASTTNATTSFKVDKTANLNGLLITNIVLDPYIDVNTKNGSYTYSLY